MRLIRRISQEGTRSLWSCQPGPAPLLALVFAICAVGQHGSAGRGMLTGQIRPVAPSPYSIPFLNPFFSFPGRLAATVSGSWFGAPPFWGAGLAPTIPPFACATPFTGCFAGYGSRNSRSFPNWSNGQGYGAAGYYPYPLYPNISMPDYYSPPPDFISGLVPIPDGPAQGNHAGVEPPNSVLPTISVPHNGGYGQRPGDTERAPNFQEVTAAAGSVGTVPKAESSSESCTDGEHPTLIALKNGWAYTIVKSWTTGKTLHFITTQGDHEAVPIGQLDRMYPRAGQRR